MTLIAIAGLIFLLIVLFRSLAKSGAKSGVSLAMLPERFVVLDLETTGLRATKDEIIEIGAIRVNRDSSVHETFQTLIRPKNPISSKIVALTGITQSMIDREGIPLEEALKGFLEFIGELPLVAFKADFDLAFLKNAARGRGTIIPNRVSCALNMSRRAWPGLKSYRLQSLANKGGILKGITHRALADCELTLTVYTAAASLLGSDC